MLICAERKLNSEIRRKGNSPCFKLGSAIFYYGPSSICIIRMEREKKKSPASEADFLASNDGIEFALILRDGTYSPGRKFNSEIYFNLILIKMAGTFIDEATSTVVIVQPSLFNRIQGCQQNSWILCKTYFKNLPISWNNSNSNQ